MSAVSNTSSSLVPPSWLSDDAAYVLSDTASAPSDAPTVQISQDEYDRLRKLEFYQTSRSSTHPSSLGMNVILPLLTNLEYYI